MLLLFQLFQKDYYTYYSNRGPIKLINFYDKLYVLNLYYFN